MKSSLKILAVAGAVLGLMAFTSSAAQALEWKVEGAALGANETVALTSKDPATNKFVPFKIEIQILGIVVECGEESSTGTLIPKVKDEGTVKLTKCTVPSPANCTVEEPIEFKVESEIFENLGQVYDLWKAKGGGALLTMVEIKGDECAVAGNVALKGQTCGQMQKGVEAVSQPLVFTKAIQEVCEAAGKITEGLNMGAQPANFKGTLWSSLSGANKGKKWGVG